MKILITGGAGFIGSHLIDQFINNHEIYIIDNLSTGKIENIQQHKNKNNFHFVKDEILNQESIEPLIKKCDIIFHLAAAVGVNLIMEQPVQSMTTNIRGTEIVLELAHKYQKRIIITSTSEVYGKSKNIPFSEETDLVFGPSNFTRWSYACSKAVDEFLALAYYSQFKLPVTIVRLFNTVGPRQIGNYGMVVPRFIHAALKNEDLIVYGTGEQVRCFAHVQDIALALASIIDNDQTIGEIINLGRPEPININQLAEIVKESLKSSSKIIKVPYSSIFKNGFEDMEVRIPNIDKAKRILKFDPRKDIYNIINDSVNYMLGK